MAFYESLDSEKKFNNFINAQFDFICGNKRAAYRKKYLTCRNKSLIAPTFNYSFHMFNMTMR